jgi:hypothetical protein
MAKRPLPLIVAELPEAEAELEVELTVELTVDELEDGATYVEVGAALEVELELGAT